MTGERQLKKVSEYLFLWALGGTIYYEFEMIFRGFSHWSMFVLGGICLCFIAWQGRWFTGEMLSGARRFAA